MSLEQGWALATEWYADRLRPGWKPKTPAQAQSAFLRIGLTGAFWQLSP